ncbi:MAG: hypothetical protein AAFW74_05610 [Pseudomonadota bacterium]
MTACSNHPGTPSGLALAELLGQVKSLAEVLREAEAHWCKANDVSRSQWLELHAMHGGGAVAGASPALVTRELVEACPGGYRLSEKGQQLLRAIDRARFDWVDASAAELAARELREQARALRRLVPKLLAGS